MNLPELLCHQETRPRALEMMLAAHLMLDPKCLEGRTWPKLTHAGAALVDLMLTENVHRALLNGVILSLRVARHVCYCHWKSEILPEPRYIHLLACTKRAKYRDVVRMAQHAEQLTVDELSFLSRDTVLALLESRPLKAPKPSKADRLLELAEEAAA